MDVTSFISSSRDNALLLGDYNSYRVQTSRRLLTLRKKLGLVSAKGGKKHVIRDGSSQESRSAVELKTDEARDAFARLSLLTSERAWAQAMHMKSTHATDSASKGITGSTRRHIISRLHKASTQAQDFLDVVSGGSIDGVTENIILEVRAYRSSLFGATEFEKQNWQGCLSYYSEARLTYDALFASTGKDVFKDILSGTIDPSIRYAAYQSRMPRSDAIPTIARKCFPKSDPQLIKLLEKQDPNIFSGKQSKGAKGPRSDVENVPETITWRTRTVPLEDASIAQALASISTASDKLSTFLSSNESASLPAKQKAVAYDTVLISSQDAVDATKHAIDELAAEGVNQSDKRMQALQITRTAVNYGLISWRVERNRVLTGAQDGAVFEPVAAKKPQKPRKDGKPWVEREESTAHKLGRLRERVVLYDATLQSIDSINDLPGVAADTNFVQELRSKRLYFQALKCLALSRCHSILSSPTHALALLSHASTHITTALPLLPHTSSQTPPFTLAPTTLSTLQSLLTHELTRHRALVELSNLTAQTAPPSSSPHAAGAAKHVPAEHTPPLIDDLTTYPPLGAVVDCAHLVTYPPRVEPVPVKPLFLDLAWNYVAYPGREGVGAGGEREEEEEGKEREEGKGKKGWFGFGR